MAHHERKEHEAHKGGRHSLGKGGGAKREGIVASPMGKTGKIHKGKSMRGR